MFNFIVTCVRSYLLTAACGVVTSNRRDGQHSSVTRDDSLSWL